MILVLQKRQPPEVKYRPVLPAGEGQSQAWPAALGVDPWLTASVIDHPRRWIQVLWDWSSDIFLEGGLASLGRSCKHTVG